MAVSLRQFAGGSDYAAVTEFLAGLYQPENRDGNWLWPIWEYAYTHPMFDETSTDRIGLWQDAGRIVALATYELHLGEAFFSTSPDHAHLKLEMLAHAEDHLSASGDDGRRLRAYVNDFDAPFAEAVLDRGYVKDPDSHRPMSQFAIPSPFPEIGLPDGFRLQSLADDNDLRKWDRCLHRGFNHPGEPPEDGIEGRRRMQSGPHYRKDIAIVAVAPSGDFVSFCGMWFDPANRLGYVEPVATDPDFRRRGLGRACVLEGIRRCGHLGADTPGCRRRR
ncbi:MAG: GNAT family N-acetyltransferase [Armatimonadetes bacterium]|nr:GNAT family N-acetyltransferase [Armatimonadota bacterium]